MPFTATYVQGWLLNNVAMAWSACVHACVRVCVRACLCACVRACVRACILALLVCALTLSASAFIEPSLDQLDFFLIFFLWRLVLISLP